MADEQMERGFEERKRSWQAKLQAHADVCGISFEQAIAVMKHLRGFEAMFNWFEVDKFLYGRGE